MTLSRVFFLIISSALMMSQSKAMPLYCKEVKGEVVSEISYCLEREEKSSAKDLSQFAKKFNEHQVERYQKELEKKIANGALQSLSVLYREKLKNFPTQKPVDLSYATKQCLKDKGIEVPRVRVNGKLSKDEEQKRLDSVKNIMKASFFAESYFKEIEDLKKENSSLVLADPRTIRSEIEIKKYRDTFFKKEEIKNKIKTLNQELLVLSGEYPQLFEKDKNIFLYPTGEMRRSKFQDKMSQHFSDKIGIASVLYEQSMISHDRSNPNLAQKTFDHVSSFIEKNKKNLFNEEDLEALSYAFEAKEAQSLVDLKKSMDELCEGNIEQLHNNPLLMTSIYETEIKNGNEVFFQMAHCQMIAKEPENPGANWGLLLAAGGLVAMSFIPGGVFAAMAIAGGVGLGAYGAHETYNSYHNLQLERGLAHTQMLNQERVLEREKELALNSYFSLLDIVSPGVGKLGKVKPASHIKTTSSSPLIKSASNDALVIESEAEDILFRKNPFKEYWKKNEMEGDLPDNREDIIAKIGKEKYLELNQKLLDYHHDAVDEFEYFLRDHEIPFKKKLRDGRISITIDKERLKELGIPALKIMDKVSDYKVLDDKLRKYMLLQKHDLLEDNPIPNHVFDEEPKMDLIYDPYLLVMQKADGLSDPRNALYLKMNDLGNLFSKSKLTGTTRHELQHRYFEVQRSQNKLDNPFHSEFIITNKEASLGKSSYHSYQSSEELYNFANQAFWDMKPGFINANRLNGEQLQKAINDLDSKIPDFEKEAITLSKNFDSAISVAEQTKANALKVIKAAQKEGKDPETFIDIDFSRGIIGLEFDKGLKFNRYVDMDDILKYQKLVENYGASNTKENLQLALEQKKKIMANIEKSARALVEKSEKVIALEDHAVEVITDFKVLTRNHYQKLKDGDNLTLEEALEIKKGHEEAYRFMRKFGLAVQD